MEMFVKGMTLCQGYFHDCAQPILQAHFPELVYSAGLLGYGSDVLGYDDTVSTDHMWGPRFYLFLRQEDMGKAKEILAVLGQHLPCSYRGYPTSFTPPDPADNGVRHPVAVSCGPIDPLIFVQTWESFLTEQLGTADVDAMTDVRWLTISEHRLLSITAGRFFHDGLHCAREVEKLRFYPYAVKLYLIASCWDMIACEQAFVKRSGVCGDEIGSAIISARIAERLMRLCFLYTDTYAPYSKWLGAAFANLPVSEEIKQTIGRLLRARQVSEREELLLSAQRLVYELHAASGIGEKLTLREQSYYGRDIRVLFVEKIAQATIHALGDHPLSHLPLIGSFSQVGGMSTLSDDPEQYRRVAALYASAQSKVR